MEEAEVPLESLHEEIQHRAEHNGATWIYLQTSEEKFQRTELALERPVEAGWFVRQGLKPEEKVVTAGAQQLLSEELKGGE